MAAAAATTDHQIAPYHRSDFGVRGGIRLRATGRSDIRDDDEVADTMAASVALLERFQQTPATAVTVTTGSAMVADGDRSVHHRRHYQNGYRPHRPKYNSVSAGSALSKSMRYADGWLYERDAGGTVGHGDRKTRSTFLGREHFGTAAAVAIAAAAAAAVNTPTAVAAQPEDPYDRVRKNRMSVSAAGKPDRKRNRSGSSRTPSPDYDDTGGGGGRVANASSRRSILECNVNPYDLLRRPSDDDGDGIDDVDDDDDDDNGDNDTSSKRMSLKDKFMNRIQDTVFTKNKSSLGGFSSFTSLNGSSKKSTSAERNNGGVNIAGHTVSVYQIYYFRFNSIRL